MGEKSSLINSSAGISQLIHIELTAIDITVRKLLYLTLENVKHFGNIRNDN